MSEQQTRVTAIRIEQMDCPTEERLLRKALEKKPGVTDLRFNLMSRVLSVTHDPAILDEVMQAIRKIGFTPELHDGKSAPARTVGKTGCCGHSHDAHDHHEHKHDHGADGHAHAQHAHGQAPNTPLAQPEGEVSPNIAGGMLPAWWHLALGGALALASELVHWFAGPAWLTIVCAIAAVALAGTATYRKGLVALRYGDLNINALMSIAVTCALLIGQWPEAAMVMVLFTLSEWIEAKSLDRTRAAVSGLMNLAPETVTVQINGQWQVREVSQVTEGSLVRVAPGERIGLDGRIVRGTTTVNQAPITGESVPVDKQGGDTVFAGTINEAGEIEIEVTAAADNTTLARIIHQIEEAQAVKAPTQRFVDSFSRYYTPAVVVLAILLAVIPPLFFGGAWLTWIYQALVVLIIACPCALVISTPVTVVSGLTAAARMGILIKGGVYLEQGHRMRWLALDKTGTITQGQPVQTGMTLLDPERSVDELQRIAVSLAARSDHPVSRAIAQAPEAAAVAAMAVGEFVAVAGRGVHGAIEDERWYLGSAVWAQELGLMTAAVRDSVTAAQNSGQSVVLLMNTRAASMLFTAADKIKDSSVKAIEQLHQLGVKTVMLSGDHQSVVDAIAKTSGVTQAQAQLLPQEKQQVVQKLQQDGHAVVGMVGDGMNDAPALAQADIGFAMGAMGSDTAIETADVALMDDNLLKIPAFLRLSRVTRRVLVQNISLALGIKAVFLVLVLMGLGSMWLAVFADVGASLLVVANGLRLLRAGPRLAQQ
ncbi:Cd2+/Zn2+-exporting ATPase [Advenella incenata]|uniref:P-type Zn(2+) transporter n=1 Tax=Advenella incenata TaxID=267800 RepID=A0A4Q7VT93_9BURK|nr:heavy metal translocating P-type ATPase [Advenella incenata]RZT99791.1 Cd2+/Zn2+-exporting ATPase [Advenella incenata]